LSSGAPVALGLVLALIISWWLVPALFFIERKQPVAFTHASHTKDQDCLACHFSREDGSFSAIPSTGQCAACHTDMQGVSEAEAEYIERYVSAKKEVPWLIRQKQPDHVFFSHTAHSLSSCRQLGCHEEYVSADILCSTCHPDSSILDSAPYLENRITGYSRDTMRMRDCKSCHASQTHLEMSDANLACQTCHK
jgi:hypothetical protein